ncbi:hypothetical protein BHECKSOX2_567 [Bathymodiolus heckerae thiotrophic gill symbiont]|nr:hypothetical protein BHECKSOX2_567 [Bathymodiolus heckerae thiotrophic gill symbiont]
MLIIPIYAKVSKRYKKIFQDLKELYELLKPSLSLTRTEFKKIPI